MLTIEEGISRFESFANLCEKNGMHEWQKEHEQYVAWLRELVERRKAPEIVRCGECKHYEWMSNRIPEEQTWHCHCWDADTGKDDFYSYAVRKPERRTDGERQSD